MQIRKKFYDWILVYCTASFAVALLIGTTFDQIVIGITTILYIIIFRRN